MKTKVWTTVGIYKNFEEANNKRNELKNKHDAVKVKCGGKDGEIFRVKIWDSPLLENKKLNKRVRKNDNKKIRARQKQT